MVDDNVPHDEFEDDDFTGPVPRSFNQRNISARPAMKSFTMPNTNPLQKYFRAPGPHAKLPSNGYFCNSGDIEFTINGEVPIYPMTSADELLLKSPDALLNGYAIERVIASCAPAIHNIRNLPSPDVDVILLGIRSATYGDKLEMDVVCPKCQHENKFSISIREAIETQTSLEPEYPVRASEAVIVYVKPYTFESTTKAALASFEEQKSFQIIERQETTDQEKLALLNGGLERLAELTLTLNSASIIKIVIPEGTVTNPQFIYEFLKNTDKNTAKKIDDKIKEINQIGINKKHSTKCAKCEHTWEPELVFDPSLFFE
jgi:T4 bacteriophage base plate protein